MRPGRGNRRTEVLGKSFRNPPAQFRRNRAHQSRLLANVIHAAWIVPKLGLNHIIGDGCKFNARSNTLYGAGQIVPGMPLKEGSPGVERGPDIRFIHLIEQPCELLVVGSDVMVILNDQRDAVP